MEAWGLEGYVRARYGLLGAGSHWFPGANADALDQSVSEADLRRVLSASPWAEHIPGLLRRLRERVGGTTSQRLMSS